MDHNLGMHITEKDIMKDGVQMGKLMYTIQENSVRLLHFQFVQ